MERQPTRTLSEGEQVRGAFFINQVGRRLRFSFAVIASACHYFHRYYVHPDADSIDMYEIAGACLYLAGKAEETSVKARDVVNASYRVLYPEKPLIGINQEYGDRKERIIDLEQVVLRNLKFDVEHKQPHLYMFNYANALAVTNGLTQTACAILSDSFCAPTVSQMSESVRACGALYLASKLTKEDIPSAAYPWHIAFDVSFTEIDDFSRRMLDFYERYDASALTSSSPQ